MICILLVLRIDFDEGQYIIESQDIGFNIPFCISATNPVPLSKISATVIDPFPPLFFCEIRKLEN